MFWNWFSADFDKSLLVEDVIQDDQGRLIFEYCVADLFEVVLNWLRDLK